MPCHAMPCHAMPCHTIPYHTIPYYIMLYYIISYITFFVIYHVNISLYLICHIIISQTFFFIYHLIIISYSYFSNFILLYYYNNTELSSQNLYNIFKNVSYFAKCERFHFTVNTEHRKKKLYQS